MIFPPRPAAPARDPSAAVTLCADLTCPARPRCGRAAVLPPKPGVTVRRDWRAPGAADCAMFYPVTYTSTSAGGHGTAPIVALYGSTAGADTVRTLLEAGLRAIADPADRAATKAAFQRALRRPEAWRVAVVTGRAWGASTRIGTVAAPALVGALDHLTAGRPWMARQRLLESGLLDGEPDGEGHGGPPGRPETAPA